MTDHKNKRKWTAIVCLLALALTMLTGCGAKGRETITSLDPLNEPGIKIGMSNNTNDDKLVAERFPQAEIEYYQDAMAGYLSVSQGKLDAFVYGKLTMETAIRNGLQGVRLLDETLGESYTMAVAIAPNTTIPDLEDKINAFLDEVKQDGTLEDMIDRWLVRKDETMPEIAVPENSDLHLVVGTSGVYEPFTYYVGTELRGYDIELAYRFAAWLGASVEFKVYDYNGIIAAAQGGDVDCLFAAIFITPERQEALRFSQPTYVEEIAVMVRSAGATPESSNKTVSWQDYNGKRIGVLVGPLMEDAAAEFFPDSEHLYFDNYPDCATALLTGKIDGFLGDEPGMISMHAEQPEIDYIHEPLTENNYAFAFRKDDPESAALCEELDEFLSRAWEDGTMDEIAEIWLGVDEARKVVDMSDLTGENGTIRVVTTSTDMPWSYIKDGKNVGYDIDLVVRFCRDRGYGLEIGDMDFAGRIPAVQSGKYDFTTDMNVTPEREEQVLFSSPTAHGGIVLAVRASDPATADSGGGSFLNSVAGSFQKTFIRENRWKLFVGGIGTTMLITVLSILFGTALGFGVFMLCRNGNPIANALTRFCVWLVQGMPMVVLLMILYYVIFGKVVISGTAVSVIGFTLVFGAAVYGMLKAGVGAIDRGQTEAAYALGYTDHKAFYRVVLPQALPHFMPAYKGEITALIKATAVVGYVAVQDLTKMGDIVRSRTYEAFFPLIAVAVIYFVLAAILTFLVNKLEIRIDPRKRSRKKLLKGVKTDD